VQVGLCIKPPPPYTSTRIQKEDARKGPNQQAKQVHLPRAISIRMSFLASYGIKRELDRTDIPYLLAYFMPKAWSMVVNFAALKEVGLNPLDRAPLWQPDIMATKGSESAIVCKQLDVSQILYKLDQADIDGASEEMARQLCGSKWGTGKMMRYSATGEVFRRCAKLVAYTAQKKKEAATARTTAWLQKKKDTAAKRVTDATEKEARSVASAAKKAAATVAAAAAKVAAAQKKAAAAAATAEKKAQKDEAAAEKKRKAAEVLAAAPTAKRLKAAVAGLDPEFAERALALIASLAADH
jgi:hypothetical protein